MSNFIYNLLNKQNDKEYWDLRYKSKETSGAGSYGEIASFKANYINRLIEKENLSSAIEFGCGDGNNLSLYHFKEYIGLDISGEAIRICLKRFENDDTKSFSIYNPIYFKPGKSFKMDAALSLDVLYHITDDKMVMKYCSHLFESSKKIVVLFTNDLKRLGNVNTAGHIKLHDVMEICSKFEEFQLVARDPYPILEKSSAEMFVFKKIFHIYD